MEDTSGRERGQKRRKISKKKKEKENGKGKRSREQFTADDEQTFPLISWSQVGRPTKRQANAFEKLLLSYAYEASQKPLSPTVSTRKRHSRAKVALIPKSKSKADVSDVIVTPRVRWYVALLDSMSSDTAQGTLWHTLTFDCFRFSYLRKVKTQLLDPDFPFDTMATDAGNCLIEFSLTDEQYTWLNQREILLQGDVVVQDLTPRTWWMLGVQRSPAPYAIRALMTLPETDSADPTTIITEGIEMAVFVQKVDFPPRDVLRLLVAMSHGTELPYGLSK
jgi:hypothetical protein